MPNSIPQLLQQVADAFDSTVAELRGSGRTRCVCEARAAAAWLLRQCCPTLTLAAIGALLGGRNHSTVIHALRQVEARMPHDPTYAATIQVLVAQHQPTPAPSAALVRRRRRAAHREGGAWWVAQATPAQIRCA